MNLQQPASRTANLASLLDKIDTATTKPGQDLAPPRHGESHRSAIIACIDGLVGGICDRIAVLHQTLDLIQQRAIASAERSKISLGDHVATCERINDEIVHMQGVVADLAESARET